MAIKPEDLELIDRAVNAAVDRVCLRLGIDPEEDGAFAAVAADLRYAHRMRVASETVGTAGIWAAIALLVGGVGTVIWVGLQMMFTGRVG